MCTAFVVDRALAGKPVAGVKVDAGFGQTLIASATLQATPCGLVQLTIPPADKSSPDNFLGGGWEGG